ncbi:hypothetical protein EJB05_47448, partial [Eragrostis curvula]
MAPTTTTNQEQHRINTSTAPSHSTTPDNMELGNSYCQEMDNDGNITLQHPEEDLEDFKKVFNNDIETKDEENQIWVQFHDIETKFICRGWNTYDIHGRWNITAKVLKKKGICMCNEQALLQFLLVDEEGSRIEAMSFGNQCTTLDKIIVEGNIYDFINVNFMSTDNTNLHNLWTIRSDFYVKISAYTKVRTTRKKINIPLCPRYFLEFENIILMRHHAFTDVIGMVVYVSKQKKGLNFRGRPSKYVAIMNMRGKFVILHIRDPQLTRHNTELKEASVQFHILAAAHIKVDWTRDVLSSTAHSNIIFNPKSTEATELQGLRNKLLPLRRQARRDARAYMA